MEDPLTWPSLRGTCCCGVDNAPATWLAEMGSIVRIG